LLPRGKLARVAEVVLTGDEGVVKLARLERGPHDPVDSHGERACEQTRDHEQVESALQVGKLSGSHSRSARRSDDPKPGVEGRKPGGPNESFPPAASVVKPDNAPRRSGRGRPSAARRGYHSTSAS
jgi:hypothetical protein